MLRPSFLGLVLALGSLSCTARAPEVVQAPEPSPLPVPEPEPEAVTAPEPEPAPAAEPEAEAAPEPVEIPEVSKKFIERVLAQQARVETYAAKHGVDPDLVNAVIWVESKFDPRAKGPAGAMGLMQLMPRTAGSLAKRLERRSRPYDPDFNIDAGCLYIARITRRFDGDPQLTLAAYNRGVGKVKSWIDAGEPIPERTQAYVDRVLAAKAWLPLLIARERAVKESQEDPPVSALAPFGARDMLAG